MQILLQVSFSEVALDFGAAAQVGIPFDKGEQIAEHSKTAGFGKSGFRFLARGEIKRSGVLSD